jgi:hypothetical protein
LEVNCSLMRSLTSIELEASVIQQSVQWWVAKENVAQFQAQLKDCTDDIRRPMIEWLLDQELAKLSALPNVMPRFSRIAASSPKRPRYHSNTLRPHTSLNELTPTEFAARPSQGHNQNKLSP